MRWNSCFSNFFRVSSYTRRTSVLILGTFGPAPKKLISVDECGDCTRIKNEQNGISMLCLRRSCRSRGEVDWWFFMSADSQKSSISCRLIVIRPLIFWAPIYDCYLCGRVAVSLYEWMKDELLTRKYLTSEPWKEEHITSYMPCHEEKLECFPHPLFSLMFQY